MTRPLDLALAWAESGSAPADARVLAEEVRAMHVYVNALESQRNLQTRALTRLRHSVLAALRAEGADPVEAAGFVREVADKLTARVAQLEPCSNPTEHEELAQLRASHQAVVEAWPEARAFLMTTPWPAVVGLRELLDGLARVHGKEA